jgi:hypothetical protein
MEAPRSTLAAEAVIDDQVPVLDPDLQSVP